MAQVVTLAVLVAVVGMPHGGLDHRFGRALLRPALGPQWSIVFVASYLAVMMVVVAGWWWLPGLTVAGFVILSAVHFGLTEDRCDAPIGLVRSALFGGMVVWVPALFWPAEFSRLLTWVIPHSSGGAEIIVAPAFQTMLAAMLPITLAWAFATSLWCGIRVMVFIVLFAVTPPLVSFALYFCGWHSGIELYRLSRQANPHNVWSGLARVVRAAIPLASLAVVMIAVGGWVVARDRPLTPALVQTIFIGLSVVAVPHMLLHWMAIRRNLNPFAEIDS
ncbi:MAG: Brp/Blh family beta-carotene 15,15'-dioxygenase [Gemmataceae bacterium]|nr:Brp/Blh family beta-carotene 15,15'-dioxygenase [Gemmata sp.]MDW8199033.1 Brp/Blh family beta-carotene 15,15'-dioxygenase [Gemmataceae bacterium]